MDYHEPEHRNPVICTHCLCRNPFYIPRARTRLRLVPLHTTDESSTGCNDCVERTAGHDQAACWRRRSSESTRRAIEREERAPWARDDGGEGMPPGGISDLHLQCLLLNTVVPDEVLSGYDDDYEGYENVSWDLLSDDDDNDVEGSGSDSDSASEEGRGEAQTQAQAQAKDKGKDGEQVSQSNGDAKTAAQDNKKRSLSDSIVDAPKKPESSTASPYIFTCRQCFVMFDKASDLKAHNEDRKLHGSYWKRGSEGASRSWRQKANDEVRWRHWSVIEDDEQEEGV